MGGIQSIWHILSRKVFNSDKQSFGQGALDREDYSKPGGMFVIGNVLVLDWVRGSWVFIILLEQRKKEKFSDHQSKR